MGDIYLNTYSISRVVTIPEFNFTMSDYNGTSTSVVYEFRVTPINTAGNGTTSDPVNGYFRGCELIVAMKNCKLDCKVFLLYKTHLMKQHTMNEATHCILWGAICP